MIEDTLYRKLLLCQTNWIQRQPSEIATARGKAVVLTKVGFVKANVLATSIQMHLSMTSVCCNALIAR